MKNQAPTDAEAVRLELQEALVSFRQVGTFAVQVAGFIAAADSLLLGYGFAQRQSVILMVASLMPILLIVEAVWVLRGVIPIGYVAMVLEQELGLRIAPLATVFPMASFSWHSTCGSEFYKPCQSRFSEVTILQSDTFRSDTQGCLHHVCGIRCANMFVPDSYLCI
jgi:hypothetical protein